MKIFVWNINQRSSGQEIPPVVSKEILKYEADIVILTEFISATDEKRLRNIQKFIYDDGISTKYDCYYNVSRKDSNGILIAIREDFKNSNNIKINKPVECMEANNKHQEQPNFLQLNIIVNEKPVSIIGTRIRIGSTSRSDLIERREQVLSLIDHLDKLKVRDKEKYENIIIAGDFNNLKISGKETEYYLTERKNYHGTVRFDTYNYHILKDDFYNYAGMDVSTPKSEPNKPTWSWVDKYRNKYKQDHIISRGVNVSATEYVWDFVNKDNGYSGKNPQDYKSSLVGYPDHAILIADVELLVKNSKNYAENHRK